MHPSQRVAITEGEHLTGTVAEKTEEEVPDYPLTRADETPVAVTVDQTGEEVTELSVTAEIEGNGRVYGTGRFVEGQCTKLTAVPDDGESFLGWYVDGQCVSVEESYRVLVVEDTTVSAHFSTENQTYGLLIAEETGSSITVSLTNNLDNSVSLQFLLAAYDQDGKMRACSAASQSLLPSESMELTLAVTDEITEIRTFVLDAETSVPVRPSWSKRILKNAIQPGTD